MKSFEDDQKCLEFNWLEANEVYNERRSSVTIFPQI